MHPLAQLFQALHGHKQSWILTDFGRCYSVTPVLEKPGSTTVCNATLLV